LDAGTENFGIPPSCLAISTKVACILGIWIDPSKSLREQAAMQKRSGQTEPQTPPSGLFRMISEAARLMSDDWPTRAAIMKSKGEQFTGQAVWQGFSSQYSHLESSAWSWCLVMIREFERSFFSMEHLNSKNIWGFCTKNPKFIIASGRNF
jgi:hypothetical protein